MTSPGLSAAAVTWRRWGLPRGLIVLLGGAAMVIIVAGVQGVAWLIVAIPLTLLAKAVLVDVDPHAGWADALLRASATKPEPPPAEATAEAERSHADTELAAAPVPSPQVEEPASPSREPTTHVT
jgi:hypothetical protein